MLLYEDVEHKEDADVGKQTHEEEHDDLGMEEKVEHSNHEHLKRVLLGYFLTRKMYTDSTTVSDDNSRRLIRL